MQESPGPRSSFRPERDGKAVFRDPFIFRLGLYLAILLLGANFDPFLDIFFHPGQDEVDPGDLVGGGILVLLLAGMLVLLEVSLRASLRHREALEESELRFRTLYQMAPIPYQSLDRNGNLLEVNDAWLKVMGLSREEVIGRWFGEFLQPGQEDLFRQRFARFKEMKEIHGFRYEMRTSGSGRKLMEFHGRVASNPDGTFKQTHCVFFDITERQALEEQLLQSQKMEAVGRLAGGVAHDFNNLLTGIMGYADLLKMKLPEGAPLEREVGEILRAAARGSGLTGQLLAFSRKQVLEPRIVQLNDLLIDTDRMLRRVIGEDIEFITLPAPDLGLVEVDPVQMEQVVLNLVINARDAMPQGGALIIRTLNRDIGAEGLAAAAVDRPGRYVALEVSDTGKGMSGEVLSRIFEPFFTTKEKGKGTGLGLSTAYGVIRQSGGGFAVDSEEGRGSNFRILLPRVERGEGVVSEPLPVSLPSAGNETILLVEDNEMVRALAREVLARHGYRVLEAGDGEEAARVLEDEATGPLHLLLTDVVMPRMNGRELGRRVALARPGVRILFMSGYTDEGLSLSDLTGPGRSFIQKPFMPRALIAKVREVLDGE